MWGADKGEHALQGDALDASKAKGKVACPAIETNFSCLGIEPVFTTSADNDGCCAASLPREINVLARAMPATAIEMVRNMTTERENISAGREARE